jgi:DNA-binding Lrp family transcriptional regulator
LAVTSAQETSRDGEAARLAAALGSPAAGARRRMWLLQLLQTRGAMTAQELADELGVAPATVRGDISQMAAAGIPVSEAKLSRAKAPGQSRPHTGYQLPAGYGLRLARAPRMAAMVQLLQHRGPMTRRQLAEALAISEQTAKRDAALLREAGLPLRSDDLPRNLGYQLPPEVRSRVERLTPAGIQLQILAGQPADPAGSVITVVYGVPGDLLPEPLLAELERAHQLKIALSAARQEHEQQVERIWDTSVPVAAARDAVRSASDQASRLRDRVGRYRRRQASQAAMDRAIADLEEAEAELAASTEALRAARARAYPELMSQFTAELERQRARLPQIHQDATSGGLGWATANTIIYQHMLAVGRVATMRRRGQAATLQDRRGNWDGTGTVSVQLQREPFDPPRSPRRVAASTGRYANQAQLHPWIPPEEWAAVPAAERRRLRKGTLRLRIGSGACTQMVTLPVVVHRMIPETADILRVGVRRRRIGDSYKAHVLVTARIPQPPPRAAGGARVAVHLRGQALPDGAVRAALIRGAGPPPGELTAAGLIRPHGRWAEAVIPAAWQALDERIWTIRARRSRNRDDLCDWLRSWAADNPGAAELLDPAGDLMASGTTEALAAAALRLRAGAPPGCAEPARRLIAWRRSDQRLRQWTAHERHQLTGRRTDAWRRVADWITSAADVVVMDRAGKAARPAPSSGDQDRPARQLARPQRLAASYELRQRIRSAASARAVAAETVQVPALHRTCGTPLEDLDRPGLSCPTCQVPVDAGLNALSHLMAAKLPAR